MRRMSDLRQELLAAFGIEHQEHLQAIRAALAAAAQGQPVDLRDVFRRAHSLKGAARAVDLPVIEEVSHRLETVFARIGERSLALDAATASVVQLGLDGIEGYVAALAGNPAPPIPLAALAALDRLLGLEAAPEPVDAAAGAARPAEAGPGTGEAASSAPAEAPPQSGPVEYLRVHAEQMEELAGAVHALSDEVSRQGAVVGELRLLEAELRGLRRDRDLAMQGIPAAPDGRQRAMDQALQQIHRRVTRMLREQRAAEWSAETAAARLRDQVERITLVPAEAVLGSLGRMVRDLARESGQDVAVRLEGLGLQADRRVLQVLKDPVVHLLRNAISHGLQPVPERLAMGKPAQAEIGLRVALRGSQLVLTVFDDGSGPDLARIEAVAIRQGLLPPRASHQPPLPEDRLLGLVFEPGFSTSEAVDRLSGRGIGLSVVAEAARRLHGAALLRPRRDRTGRITGAEVEIAVPFSASRQKLLLLEAAGQTYGLPSRGVDRLLRLPVAALESVEGQPVTRIDLGGRDVMAPVIPLAALLGLPSTRIPVEAGIIQAVLLRAGDRRCAVAVDALQDVRSLMVEVVDAPGLDTALVAGAIQQQDSQPALVLSPEGLVGRWLREEGGMAAAGIGLEPAPQARATATILVVDDSITTRTLEKSILEAQGFRVLLSVDGLDALSLLRSGEAMVDLVVADVEMPRMDGFGLLQAMKNDPRLSGIPVVLMTSRADPEDVRRGLELGAGAYLTKQKFDQRDLLATIGQML
jgi:two-component system chemotaxis sensor kinase CheA